MQTITDYIPEYNNSDYLVHADLNSYGENAYPSMQKIAQEVNKSITTVSNSIQKIRKLKTLKVKTSKVKFKNNKFFQHTNKYTGMNNYNYDELPDNIIENIKQPVLNFIYILKNNPGLTIKEYAEIINKTSRTVDNYIKILKKYNLIFTQKKLKQAEKNIYYFNTKKTCNKPSTTYTTRSLSLNNNLKELGLYKKALRRGREKRPFLKKNNFFKNLHAERRNNESSYQKNLNYTSEELSNSSEGQIKPIIPPISTLTQSNTETVKESDSEWADVFASISTLTQSNTETVKDSDSEWADILASAKDFAVEKNVDWAALHRERKIILEEKEEAERKQREEFKIKSLIPPISTLTQSNTKTVKDWDSDWIEAFGTEKERKELKAKKLKVEKLQVEKKVKKMDKKIKLTKEEIDFIKLLATNAAYNETASNKMHYAKYLKNMILKHFDGNTENYDFFKDIIVHSLDYLGCYKKFNLRNSGWINSTGWWVDLILKLDEKGLSGEFKIFLMTENFREYINIREIYTESKKTFKI